MKSPRGFRNNNPGNIRQSKQRFKGEVVPSKDAAFKQFTDMAHGFRAIMCILRTYMTKYELCNIAKIITRWAPPAENDTQAYISLVTKLMRGERRVERGERLPKAPQGGEWREEGGERIPKNLKPNPDPSRREGSANSEQTYSLQFSSPFFFSLISFPNSVRQRSTFNVQRSMFNVHSRCHALITSL